MNSRSLIKLFVFCMLLLAGSCKKVIQLDLKNATPQIVIEGEITNQPGPYHVQITKTVDFSASNTFPPVSGATVVLRDTINGLSALMAETSPGIYSTNAFSGIPLHVYELSVTSEGKEYDAFSTMPATVGLDSVSFVANLDFNNHNVINAVANFQDPYGVSNYYQFKEKVDSFEVPDILVFEDRLSDGKYIRATLFNDTARLFTGDTLTLDMYCIDKAVYNYFFSLQQVLGNASFVSATPANPNSNFSNGALGYFSAHTVNEEKLRVY